MTMDVTFLGTSAGKPSLDRNVSSLGLRLPDGQIWIYDCGVSLDALALQTAWYGLEMTADR